MIQGRFTDGQLTNIAQVRITRLMVNAYATFLADTALPEKSCLPKKSVGCPNSLKSARKVSEK